MKYGIRIVLLFIIVLSLAVSAADADKRVVIVTGVDYPGHKWKLTTPVLRDAIAEDSRLKVDVVQKPAFLAEDKLHEYDVVVLHFMDWEVDDPGDVARANLKKFVEGGKGMVVAHFACGAFQEWPEFANLAGRAWNPKMRGHDPHGKFKVEIIDSEHPITKGMKSFDITDELYTCLDGDRPIHIIAKSKSKVDKKDYPMAFVFNYGKGRVFHSPLGHDVVAFSNPDCGKLFRRGTAWAAGLNPDTPPKNIVLIAGRASHGPGTHSHAEGVQLLEKCLDTSPNVSNIEVKTAFDGWPNDASILDDADTILIFSDGDGGHPLGRKERRDKIDELMKKGVGLCLIHYAVTPVRKEAGVDFLEWIGGFYENGYSTNPMNIPLLTPATPKHPISRGLKEYTLNDEFYYRIRFRENDKRFTPILTAMLPKNNPEKQVLAWAVQRKDGGRGFGFTGGHFHKNWENEQFRKMVLNAVLWTSKKSVPQNGVESIIE